MCSLSSLLVKKLDIDTLQSLNSKRITRKHLSSKLYIGGVSKFVLIFANTRVKISLSDP